VRLEDGEGALRPLTEEDVPEVVAACQDPEIPRWTLVPSPYTEDDAREFLARASDVSAIVDAESGEFFGAIGWHWVDGNVQVGYWVKREARGRGVASRALRLLARWAFTDLGAVRVQLLTEPENRASQRVAEKAGFRREALLRSFIDLKGRRADVYMYALLRDDPSPAGDADVG
jgi:RimJ/RimL family protein N-acetyltransferase